MQHAHQKGIIHRDLKPSNTLVALQDGRPVPKVIDFGIAKATQQRLTDKTSFTQFRQFIGTPAYMSPEQAELGGLDIDTRSDIYSLGVLLYELLTGKPPFEPEALLKASLDEMRRIIRETEPPKPSTRLTMTLAHGVPASAGRASEQSGRSKLPCGTPAEAGTPNRSSRSPHETKRLIAIVRGDLDWIVMKCLEKDRTRRYETATSLAEDLQRHLNHEPVTAVAPGKLYRLGKFVRRHKTGLSTGTALVLLLVAGVVVSTWQAVRATRAEQRERAEATNRKQVATFLQEMLEGVKPSVALGRDTTLMREILSNAVQRLSKELKDQPEVAASLRMTISRVYAELGEYAKAEVMLREALADYRKLFGDEHAEVARALCGLAAMLMAQDRLKESESLQRDALAMRRKVLGNEHLDVTSSLLHLGGVLLAQDRLAEAEAMFREALAMRRKLFGNEYAEIGASLHGLTRVLVRQGKLTEAEAMARESLAMDKESFGEGHPNTARSLDNLASVLTLEDKLAEAEVRTLESLAMHRKLKGSEHPDIALALDRLADLLAAQGKLTEAEAMAREALAMHKKLLGETHLDTAGSLGTLAEVLQKQGRPAEAEVALRESLATIKKVLGEEHSQVAATMANLASALRDQRKLAEAEATARQALALARKVPVPEVARVFRNLALVLADRGKLDEAETTFREALNIRRKVSGAEHVDVAESLCDLALVLGEQENLTEAETMAREALAMRRKLRGPEHEEVAGSLVLLAWVLQLEGKLGEAEPLFRQAASTIKKLFPDGHPTVSGAFDSLVTVLRVAGKLTEYESCLRAAAYARLGLASDGPQSSGVEDAIKRATAAIQDRGPEEIFPEHLTRLCLRPTRLGGLGRTDSCWLERRLVGLRQSLVREILPLSCPSWNGSFIAKQNASSVE